jgi:hypothetical protein
LKVKENGRPASSERLELAVSGHSPTDRATITVNAKIRPLAVVHSARGAYSPGEDPFDLSQFLKALNQG